MVRKYKLAVLNAAPTRYQSPFFRELAKHHKIDLTVYFCVNEPKCYDRYALEGYNYKFLRNYSLDYRIPFFGKTNIGIIRELIVNKYDAILVYGYSMFTCYLAFLAAYLTKTPILMIGAIIEETSYPLYIKLLRKIFLRPLFRTFSAFLSVGTLNTKFYMNYGVPKSKIFLVPYPVDTEFFRKKYKELKEKKKKLRKELNLSSNLPVILRTSRLIPEKRPLDLLKAYEIIQDNINAQVVFVGDGSERKTLEKYVKKNNLKNVYFAGFKGRETLSKYYAAADVFVVTSEYETWGSVINEAMCFGLPIITTDKVGASHDLVKHGKNGFIYKPGDINALAFYLETILNNHKLMKKLGEESLNIISKWTFKEDVEGVIRALDFVLNKNKIQ